jgi:hypothetical protein
MKTMLSSLFALVMSAVTAAYGQEAKATPVADGYTESQSAQLSAIGALAMQTVYVTHMAVNHVGDAWAKGVYTDEVALTLAGGYLGGLDASLKAMENVVAKADGLSEGDLESLKELIACGNLVMDQVNAFIAFVPDKDPAMAQAFETKRLTAQKRVFAMMGIDPGDGATAAEPPGPKKLVFEILEAQLPQGGPGQKGTATFTRDSTDEPFSVRWEYTDGTFDTGFAVPFPGSKAIAVGFGPDVLGVAIYQLDGKNVEARWAPYEKGAAIGSYTMQQGENDSIYRIEGEEEGTFLFEELDADTARLAWKYESGELTGFGVAVGNHLAAVSAEPGGQSGVAIYIADPESGSAEGRWTTEFFLGKVGKEKYKLLSVE